VCVYIISVCIVHMYMYVCVSVCVCVYIISVCIVHMYIISVCIVP
jgi:hypothetical protein